MSSEQHDIAHTVELSTPSRFPKCAPCNAITIKAPPATNHGGCAIDVACIFITPRFTTLDHWERGCFSFAQLIYLEPPGIL